MAKFDTTGMFTCLHHGYHHLIFRVTCPVCGRVLVRDLSETPVSPGSPEKAGIYSGQFIAKGIAFLTLIWIIILLLFYLF